MAVRDRLEPVAQAPARRGPAAARERPDGGGREAADRRARAAALDARLLFPRVADAIEALPDGEREALLLFAWEDLSYQSVAEALELPVGTVRSRLNRARARLRELLEPGGESKGEVAMRPMDLVRKLRREDAVRAGGARPGEGRAHGGDPAGGRARAPTDHRAPASVCENIHAALAFLERAFGFREIPSERLVNAEGELVHAMLEFRGGWSGSASRAATARSARRAAASRASTSACTSTTSMRTTSARSPRVHGS